MSQATDLVSKSTAETCGVCAAQRLTSQHSIFPPPNRPPLPAACTSASKSPAPPCANLQEKTAARAAAKALR